VRSWVQLEGRQIGLSFNGLDDILGETDGFQLHTKVLAHGLRVTLGHGTLKYVLN
jgi:hypothetical protein